MTLSGKDLVGLFLERGWQLERIKGQGEEVIFYAKLHKEKAGYWTEFPELGCTGSQGATIGEVLKNSQEALEGVLESLFDRRCQIPRPRLRKGKMWLPVPVDDSIAVPIILRQLRLGHRLTLKQMADKLGVTYQSYQALETPKRANPTLRTLRRVAQVLGVPLRQILKDVA